jgi:predicted DNA-binding transcriptional regulator YafY
MALAKQRHFDILRQVLGMVEERGTVPVNELAAAVDIDAEQLRTLLGPVLFLEFETSMGDWVETAHDFLLNEDDEIELTHEHWLRDLASAPPSADAALRLLVAGLAMQSVATTATPDLDGAVKKLRGVVDTELQVSLPTPPCLGVAQEALAIGRSLCFRYVRDRDDVISDREVLPFRVYCRWGHWYVQGREVDGDTVKQFRIDRMQGATIGDVLFDAPPDSEIPEWFDLSRHERTVRLRLTPAQASALARPHTVSDEVQLDDGRVELDVTVAGNRRLDYLLLTLDPDVEVMSPPEARDRQREVARQLLAVYDD